MSKNKFKLFKVKTTLLFLTIIIICIFFIKVNNKMQPSSQYPFILTNPHLNSKTDIIIKFSFNSLIQTSTTLRHSNFLCIEFPYKVIEDNEINFSKRNEDGSLKYRCFLHDALNKIYVLYANTPSYEDENDSTYDKNIIFCQFLDEFNSIPINTELTLIISLNTSFSNTNVWQYVNMFVSTTNKKEKIILDYLPLVGSFYMYNQINSESSILSISKVQLESNRECPNGDCVIYPYEKVNIIMEVVANDFVPLETYANLVVQLDNNFLSFTDISEIYSEKASDLEIEKELQKGQKDIGFEKYNDFINYNNDLEQDEKKYINSINMINNNKYSLVNNKVQYLVTNIGENLVKNRKFKLILKQIEVSDINLKQSFGIELIVYSKNNFSILSYSKKGNFEISPLPILNDTGKENEIFSGISNPNFIDIYQSGAWPITFKFLLKEQSINKPVWILIQHSNTSKVNRFNFIASTCDFSENISKKSSIDNDLIKRPICYPLRNDFNYFTKSDEEYAGSGVFFKLSNLNKNLRIIVTIWGYAEVCGENQMQLVAGKYKMPNPLGSDASKSIVTFRFNYKVFTGINSDNLNSNNNENLKKASDLIKQAEFLKNPNLKISNQFKNFYSFSNLTTGDRRFIGHTPIAEGLNIEMKGNCYSNLISGLEEVDSFKDIYSYVKLTPDNKAGDDVLMYKEITDFSIGTHASEAECNNCYMMNVNSNYNDNFDFKLFSNSVNVASPFLGLKANIRINKNDKPAYYFPMPVYEKDNKLFYQHGKLELNLNSHFFGEGSSNCFFSWASKLNRLDSNISQTNLFSSSQSNNFIQKSSNISKSTIASLQVGDSGYSNPTFTFDSPKNMITSKYVNPINDSQSQIDFDYFRDALFEDNNQTNKFNRRELQDNGIEYDDFGLHLYTNCFKYKYMQSIKSIYSYFEVILKWKIVSLKEDANRVIRFIKLYPEPGVFGGNSSSIINNYPAEPLPFKVHFGYSAPNKFIDTAGICIIELTNIVIKGNNSIGIFFKDFLFLDTDFNEIVSTYPVAPLVSGNGYLLNSSFGLSKHSYLYKQVPETLGSNKMTNSYNRYTNTPNKSSYHFYLSPLLIITGFVEGKITSSQTSQSSLLIPFYCPSSYSPEYISDNNTNNIDMRISIVYFSGSISSYDQIPPLYKIGVQNNNFNLIVKKNNINNEEANKFSGFKPGTLKFKPYSNVGSTFNYPLYIVNGNKEHIGSKVNCTGFALLINSSIEEDNNSTSALEYLEGNQLIKKEFYTSVNNTLKSLGSPIIVYYAYGIKFNRMKLLTTSNLEIENNIKIEGKENKIDKETKYYITNIARPNIEKVNSNFKLESLFNYSSVLFNTFLNENIIKKINNPESIIDTDEFNSNFNVGLNNLIGFSCSSSDLNTNNILSNISIFSNSGNIPTFEYKAFLLDFSADLENKWDIRLFNEREGDFYKDNNTASIRMEVKIPGNLPQYSSVNFKSNNFLSNTICAFNNGNSFSLPCITNEEDEVSCLLSNNVYKNERINICCYNVSTSYDPITFNKLYVNYPLDNRIKESSYINLLNSPLLTNEKEDLFYLETKNESAETLSNNSLNISGNINSLFYNQSIHVDGLGIANIRIDITRTVLYGMKINIQGNFKEFYFDISPKCTFSFSDTNSDNEIAFKYSFNRKRANNSIDYNVRKSVYGYEFDKGDFMVEYCNPGNFLLSSNTITLNFKNIIHKCGLSSYGRSLYVKLWPVKIVDFNDNKLKDRTYKINGFINENIAYTTQSSNMIIKQSLIDPIPTVDGKIKRIQPSLCNLVLITPNIIGAESSFTFVFDTETDSKNILNTKLDMNEVTILWDLNKYRFSSILHCIYENKLIHCDVDYNSGFMNIYLSKPLSVARLTNIEVVGVITPQVNNSKTSSADEFACSINNIVDYGYEKVRRNIVVGFGKAESESSSNPLYKSNISQNNGVIVFYLLPMNQIDVKTKSLYLPKYNEIFVFRISFDVNSTTIKKSIGNPVIVITFPKQFSFYTSNSKLNISFKLFEHKQLTHEFNGSFITQEDLEKYVEIKDGSKPAIVPKIPIIKGNTIIVELSNSAIVLSENFAFIEVSILPITNPIMETESLNKSIRNNIEEVADEYISRSNLINTDEINVIFFSIDGSHMYRTYPNTNNFIYPSVNEELLDMSNKILPNVLYSKGIRYKYSTSSNKIIINFRSENSISNNIIIVKAGRYSSIEATLENKNLSTEEWEINTGILYLDKQENSFSNSNLFDTSEESYLVSTVGINIVNILLGTRCNIYNSLYYINFKIGDPFQLRSQDNFYNITPIQVYIDKEKVEIKLYSNPLLTNNYLINNNDIIDVYKSGRLFLYYSISDPIFSKLPLEWINKSDLPNKDIYMIIGYINKKEKEGFSELYNLPEKAVAYQKFKFNYDNNLLGASDINDNILECVKLNAENIEFKFVNTIPNIKNEIIKDSFAYFTSEEDTKLNKNEIKIVYSPKFKNVFLFCNLVCFNSNYSTEEELLDYKKYVNSSLKQHKTLYINDKFPVVYPIKFDNLIRGQQYKIKCSVYSPDTNITKTETREAVFDTFSNTSQFNIEIKPTDTKPVSCITYSFIEEPDQELLDKILKVFQYLFVKNGFYESGCVYAIDNYGNTFQNFKEPKIKFCNLKYDRNIYNNINDIGYDYFARFLGEKNSNIINKYTNFSKLNITHFLYNRKDSLKLLIDNFSTLDIIDNNYTLNNYLSNIKHSSFDNNNNNNISIYKNERILNYYINNTYSKQKVKMFELDEINKLIDDNLYNIRKYFKLLELKDNYNNIYNYIRNLQYSALDSYSNNLYTVCGVTPKNCPTDVKSQKASKKGSIIKYEDIINEIASLSLNAKLFQTNYKTNSTYFSSASIKTEAEKINLDNLIITKFHLNETYFLKIVASYNTNLICYYRIQLKKDNVKPTLLNMICNKTNTTHCGIIKVTQQGYDNIIDLSDKTLLTRIYNFYIVCFHDLMGASRPSDIINVVPFSFSQTELCEDNCTLENETLLNNKGNSNITYCDPDDPNLPCYTIYLVKRVCWFIFVIVLATIFN